MTVSPPAKQSPQGDLRRLLPGFMISAITLAVLLYFVDLGKFVQALRLVDYRYIVLLVGITILWLLVRANAWKTLLQDQAPVGVVFWTINQGYVLNNLLPFRLGEVARAYLLSKKTTLGFWQVFSTIIIERLLDLAMAVGLLFSTLPFVVGATWAREAAIGMGGIVAAAIFTLFLIARNRSMAEKMLGWLGSRWVFIRRLEDSIARPILDGLVVLNDGWRFSRALIWFVLNWVVGISQYVLMVRAFFPHAPVLWGAFCLGVAALGVAAPSSPGSVGVFEGAVVAALALFDQDPSVALALAISLHLVQILTTGVFGSIAMARDGETLLGLYQRVRQLAKR